MLIDRRKALAALTCTAAAAISYPALSQDSREIYNFVSAFPPGSGADVLVRFWSQKLMPIVPGPIVVVNKPGAMGFLAAEYTARSKPDGHTIFVHAGTSIAGNMHVFKNPPFDVTKDLKVAATLSRHSYILVVGKSAPYKNLQDLTTVVRPKGDKATYGTSNTSSFLIGELYKQKADLKVVNVNYRTSADLINDLNSGALDFAIVDSIAALGVARQGNWRLLAIGSGTRMASTPDLPTFAESGYPGIDIVSWWGALVPTSTPQPIVDTMRGWFNTAVQSPDTAEFLKATGNDVYSASPQEAAGLLAATANQWKDFVEIAKIEKI
ncbi:MULTISPECIES: tripartite tricarboxylate transporter substrate binding protein [unclassified Beijerinckia]|uniref:Bug family tripartite tricarboxylate transporter substrate binding protein n=1 Tax=unclassified Beijerinckia TaxID=2638183 RepID=UPI00089C0643|nr:MULTISPECIES: tripartite tricarboxylate transporter substrate binding protein [unclassified Beijerinckia]MDH7796878.1 tripartite-type tricarboxylate transporter receptor subunit TctC [Beijerinckia sp. GAS462]SEC63404.1 Tripartite-type tricarboxylate transporter, receptor component TctC [Beijerinckia sp. 28-YEA-48]